MGPEGARLPLFPERRGYDCLYFYNAVVMARSRIQDYEIDGPDWNILHPLSTREQGPQCEGPIKDPP